MKRLSWILVGGVVLALSAATGFLVTARWLPDRLHAEVEARLADAVGTPVALARLDLRGFALRLEGEGLRMWPAPVAGSGWEGASLQVDRVAASLDPVALVLGRIRLRELVLERPRLRITRDPEGRYRPAPFAALAARREERVRSPHPEEILSPLIAMEGVARFLLSRPLLADTLVVHDGRVVFEDARVGGPVAIPVQITLGGVEGRLRHRSLRRDAALEARARVAFEGRERGALEWRGDRARDGALRLTVAVTGLDLDVFRPYARAVDPRSRLAGEVSGAIAFESAVPGAAGIQVDLLLRRLEASVPAPAVRELRPIAADRASLELDVQIAPESVSVARARFVSGPLHLLGSGELERPLRGASEATLALEMRSIDVSRSSELFGWLPSVLQEKAAAIARPVEAGRLSTLGAGGRASLDGWRAFLSGRTEELPRDFAVTADVAELALRVGEDQRIEHLHGRLAWAGDRLEVLGAHAALGGDPLPRLDLVVDGVSHLFAADPHRRALRARTAALPGLAILLDAFEGDSDGPGPPVGLEIERIDHAMFLWPLEALEARIGSAHDGLRISLDSGLWAGVPVRGDARWVAGEDRVAVSLVASAPGAPAPVVPAPAPRTGAGAADPPVTDAWAAGRFHVGRVAAGPWRQREARGRFRALGSRVELLETNVALAPEGALTGTARLDLGDANAVPFSLRFSVSDADLESLASGAAGGETVATGRLDAAGVLEGTVRPDASVFEGLDGRLTVTATHGRIHRSLPPVVAVALASESFNPFARRDFVRYERVEAILRLDDGTLRADSLTLDGPDLRVLATGALDLARPPHALDAEVALFLFRQLDRVVDRIPVLNVLLLGEDENMIAAYFDLNGPWGDPDARLVPMRSLASGPGSLVLQGIPQLVRKGIRAIGSSIGSWMGVDPPGELPAAPEPVDPRGRS